MTRAKEQRTPSSARRPEALGREAEGRRLFEGRFISNFNLQRIPEDGRVLYAALRIGATHISKTGTTISAR